MARYLKMHKSVRLVILSSFLTSCINSSSSQEFTAKNKKYFPDFVENFFPKTSYYNDDYPSLALARSELRLIEVKQLTHDNLKFNQANLSWSADGAYLGYEVVTLKERKILLKGLDNAFSKNLFVIPKKRQTFLDGMLSRSIQSYNSGLNWSRTSNKYAFMSNGGIGEYNIYVGEVGKTERVIAKSPTKDGYANWNPKKNEIAFVSSRSGNANIYTIDVSNSELKKISSGSDADLFPEWFPDGKGLVYTSGDSFNHDIYIALKEDGNWNKPYKLTNWQQDDLRPKISPNGKYIAFYSTEENTSSRPKKWNLHVLKFKKNKTYNKKEIKKSIIAKNVIVDLNTGPAWTPDSQKIFYVSKEMSKFNPIYGYDLFSGRRYLMDTKTKMNRDILFSKLGIMSFRAQVGVWDRVFVALTNQGQQLQKNKKILGKIHYLTD